MNTNRGLSTIAWAAGPWQTRINALMKWNVRVRAVAWCAAWIAFAVVAPTPAQETKPAAGGQVDTAAILAEASSLYRKGAFDQALARYNDLLKADAASGDGYAGIVRCYLKQDKVREADAALQKGLQASPGHLDFKVAEGELLFRQGEIPEAGKLFDEVIAAPASTPLGNNPPNARAYLGAARVAAASAMYAREQVLVTRAHEIDASDPDVQKMWMQTLSVGDRIKALEDYLSRPGNEDESARRSLTDRLNLLKASHSAQAARCRLVSEVKETEANLRLFRLGSEGQQGMGLWVTINGQESNLLLDTGASGILINSKLAKQAGLQTVSEVRMAGVGDKPDAQAHLAYADSVRVGKLEFQNCPVRVVERLAAGDDGIIGADVFSQFLIEMDFPTSTLRLSQLPPRPGERASKVSLKTGDDETAAEPEPATPSAQKSKYFDRYVAPEMHSYVQAFRVGHMLLVPTQINEGPKKLFLLDSGAFDNTIHLEAAQEVTKVHRAPRLDLRGLNGEVKKVFVADQVTLDFGHLRQTVPNMVAFDMSRVSKEAGVEVSGTLGMVMLEMLKVRLDYRDALADFQYTKKAGRR